MSHVVLVSNPKSGSSDDEALERVAKHLSEIGEVIRVAPGSVDSFADELDEPVDGAAAVVVAGGDGTLNHAVNGLRDKLDETQLGLVPMGTGNDLARSMGIPLEPGEAAAAIVSGRSRPLDVGIARSAGAERLFVNACMGGFPVSVDEAMEGPIKERLGPFAFWVGGAKALTDLIRYEVSVGDRRWEGLLALGVGNGKTAGGGIRVFPQADPCDGRLDICALAADSVADGLRLVTRLRSGEHVELPTVDHVPMERFTVEATPQMEFNVDGELVDMVTPVEFCVFGSTRLRH
jgi:diacylglycerol kinase (ATP)